MIELSFLFLCYKFVKTHHYSAILLNFPNADQFLKDEIERFLILLTISNNSGNILKFFSLF